MSYRSIKRLLGETSLERKCRFLFGGGLFILITGSFYVYAQLTSDLVYRPYHDTARQLVSPILLEEHWTKLETSSDFEPVIKKLSDSFKPKDVEYRWQFFKPDLATAEGSERPDDSDSYEALLRIIEGEQEVVQQKDENEVGEYHYYAAVHATDQLCADCHNRPPFRPQKALKKGDLLGVLRVAIPLVGTRKALNWNNAILITTAIVTTFLAMLAAYAIVRYVIVKPVLHLKDVSDEIARGTLDLRADIRTGDEFEELSHAFNRMLRHLTTVQDELRQVNGDLDAKVDELAQVNLRLYETNKLKDEFLATMSHELRTPLNSILGFSEVLADGTNLNDKQQRFVGNIQRSGRDLMLLINDLLDLAKIESGKMELQITEFSLRDLVDRQVGAMLPMAQKKSIDLSTLVDPHLPPLVQDAGKLQQILNNLLSNAVKFTPEGGRVRLRAEQHDERFVDLIVEDSGIGIPLEEQATIFEKFRQGRTIPGQRDAMTREYGGTGLGLSIVKELTRLLDGEVFLESEFGKGSTFTIRLPIRLDTESKRLDLELQARMARRPEPLLIANASGNGSNGDGHADAATAAGASGP